MPYDEELASRVRDAVAATGVLAEEKRMFGGLAFLLGGNMSVAVMSRGDLLVRVPAEQTAGLLAEPGANEFDMSGRGPMAGWIRVDATAVGTDDELATWVIRGVDFARSLPPKR